MYARPPTILGSKGNPPGHRLLETLSKHEGTRPAPIPDPSAELGDGIDMGKLAEFRASAELRGSKGERKQWNDDNIDVSNDHQVNLCSGWLTC